MMRLVFFCAIVLVNLWSVSSSQFLVKDLEVILEKNSTDNGEVIEEVTFKSKPKTKQASSSGVIEVTFGKTFTKPKRTRVEATKRTRVQATKRRRHHLRRRCCEVGDLAAKNGFSCSISRNWSKYFLNQTTRMTMKFQITKSNKGTSIRDRVRSKREYHIFRRINKCVRQQMKSAVQKCCLAYVAQDRAQKQG